MKNKIPDMENNKNAQPVLSEKDKNAVTLELMRKMKLTGMANAFVESLNNTVAENMTPDAFVSMLVSREWDHRSAAAIQRLIKSANFRYPNVFAEEIDYLTPRNLNQNQMERVLSLDFVAIGKDLFITGPSGTGKSFIATAIGYEACKKGIRTIYSNAAKLLGALKVAKQKNVLEVELKKIEKAPLLILDDLFLVTLDPKERPILMEIIEDRHGRKSMIITSQYPVDKWHQAIGDPTVGDAIMDRIAHTALRIELTGESLRKLKGKNNK